MWARRCVCVRLWVWVHSCCQHTLTHTLMSAFQSASRFVINNKNQMTIKSCLCLWLLTKMRHRKAKAIQRKVTHTHAHTHTRAHTHTLSRVHCLPLCCSTLPAWPVAPGWGESNYSDVHLPAQNACLFVLTRKYKTTSTFLSWKQFARPRRGVCTSYSTLHWKKLKWGGTAYRASN